MHKAQAIADLSLELASVTSAERAIEIINRALRATGLRHATTIDEADMQRLLVAIAAEGGPIQQMAEQIAIHGVDLDAGADTTAGPSAA
jgi:hypothetical protein